MSAEDVLRAWFEDVHKSKNLAAVHSLMHEDCKAHLKTGPLVGPTAISHVLEQIWQAMPDHCMEIVEMIGNETDAVARWKACGTHTGHGMNMQPSNARVEFTGMSWIKVKDGKMTDLWDEWDAGSMLAQLQPSA